MAEQAPKSTTQFARRPPPPPPAAPKYFVMGQGLGIRPMNAIRRNLAARPAIPVGRYSTLEPIPLPLGLDHLYHMPAPKRVNGGKGKGFAV